ncbi:MAG: hypothetical protein KAW47_10810 [Thermoplasmatales archaeon]|nr:hypothetical protein [Thermoplasmatales archaeon]
MKTEELDKLGKSIFSAMNYDDRGFTKMMSEKLSREHRTLQQNYVRSVANILIEYCDDDSGSDGRNEASKAFACKVKDLMHKENIAFPLI